MIRIHDWEKIWKYQTLRRFSVFIQFKKKIDIHERQKGRELRRKERRPIVIACFSEDIKGQIEAPKGKKYFTNKQA